MSELQHTMIVENTEMDDNIHILPNYRTWEDMFEEGAEYPIHIASYRYEGDDNGTTLGLSIDNAIDLRNYLDQIIHYYEMGRAND